MLIDDIAIINIHAIINVVVPRNAAGYPECHIEELREILDHEVDLYLFD